MRYITRLIAPQWGSFRGCLHDSALPGKVRVETVLLCQKASRFMIQQNIMFLGVYILSKLKVFEAITVILFHYEIYPILFFYPW